MSYSYASGLGTNGTFTSRRESPPAPEAPTSKTIPTISPLLFGKMSRSSTGTTEPYKTVQTTFGKTAGTITAKDKASMLAATSSNTATITGKAIEQSVAAATAAARIKALESKIAGLSSTIRDAERTGAPSAEVTALQAQISELTMALADAQQEHIAAAQAAAEAHRNDMGILQLQINELVTAIQGAQAAGANEQVALLQAQIAAMQQQLAESRAAADVEEEAAEETSDEAATLEPWYDRYRTHLYIGAGLAALAAAYFFTRPRTAMHLPVPTTPASPSGLAANPRKKTRGVMVREHVKKLPSGKKIRIKSYKRAR